MSPDARVYVVITTLIPIHSAAMWYVLHVRVAGVVGARSAFQSGLSASGVRSGGIVIIGRWVERLRLRRVSRGAARERVLPRC
jgi:hypothetical protein